MFTTIRTTTIALLVAALLTCGCGFDQLDEPDTQTTASGNGPLSGGQSTTDSDAATAGTAGNSGQGATAGPQTIDDLCWWETCAADQWCVAGTPMACTPVTCQLPAINESVAWQVTALKLLPESQACDLDGDGAGDNQVANVLTSMKVESDATAAILQGRYTQLLQLAPAADGVAMELVGYTGVPDPQALADGCVPGASLAKDRCPVRLRKESMRLDEPGVCRHHTRCVGAPNPIFKGQTVFDCGIAPQPVLASPQVALMGHGVTMTGKWPANGGVGTLKVCGALSVPEIEARVDLIPAAVAKPLGGREAIHSILKGVLKPDLDSDGDGVNDRVSFAAELTLREVKVLGWAQGLQ